MTNQLETTPSFSNRRDIPNVLVRYEFDDLANYQQKTTNAVNVTPSIYDFYSDHSQALGVSGGGNPVYCWLCRTLSSSTISYTFFSLTVSNGYSLTVSNLTFDSKRKIDAPTSYNVFYSTNGSDFYSMGNGGLSGSNWTNIVANNAGVPLLNVTGTVYFRIHGFNWGGPFYLPLGSEQYWYHDNVTVNGAVVAGANVAPTNITISSTSVAENLAIGTTVGVLSTQDPDAGNTFTYTLVSGDVGSFAISGGSNLQTAAAFNYEVKSTYSIGVQSADQGGLSTQKVFTITVTDIVEPAPVLQEPDITPDGTAVIRWSGLSNHTYTVHHATNLLTGFSVLHADIPATPAVNAYTDTVNGVQQKFWKVSTEP